MPKTSLTVPPDLVAPLRDWRNRHPGAALADLLRIALTPPPSTTTSAPNGHDRQAHEHETRELAELRALVDDHTAQLARIDGPDERQADDHDRAALSRLERDVSRLTQRLAELARLVDDHQHEHDEHHEGHPARNLAEYQQRLEDSAEARAQAYHATLTDAIGHGPRQITTADAAQIWACVTQSARDRLRMLAAFNLATVDDTGRAHIWTIAPSTSTSTTR